MDKIKYLCRLALLIVFLSACTLKEEDIINSNTPETPGTVINGMMENIILSGIVTDTDGNPVSGVTVSSGESVETTNSAGLFSFSSVDVVANRSVVRFSKPGYFDLIRSFKSNKEDVWEVVISKKGNSSISTTSSFSSSSAKTLSAGGMKIDLAQNGYITDSTGKSFSGEVNAEMLYLDPNNENFADMMPGGDLAAVRSNGNDALLVSYGMTYVNLTDSEGNKLQLKEGSLATLTFPIPEGMDENPHESIPLWSFNENTGLWEEEGEAKLIDNVYIGQVKHFSWVNLDYPEEQAEIEGYVKDDQGRPVPKGTIINVGQVTTKTAADGYYKQSVPAKEDFEISVQSKNYGNYRNIYSRPIKALEPKEVKRIDITLPTLFRVYGRIFNEAGGTNIASIYLTYGNEKSLSVVSGYDGQFSIFAPDGYNGEAALNIITVDKDIITKDIVLGGYDVNVGDIIISSTTKSGGQLHVELSNGTQVTFDIDGTSNNGDELSGVIIFDNQLIVTPGNSDGFASFEMLVENYEESKNSYEDVTIYLVNESQQLNSNVNNKVSINKKSGKYVFELEGHGNYYWIDAETDAYLYDSDVFFSANDITLDMIMSAKSYRNVNPKEIGVPSYTPVLSSKAPLMTVISESYFGNGVTINYNGTKNDFKTLKAQADKSGIKKIYEEEDSGYFYIVYYSNNKMIQLEYDSEGDVVDENFDPVNGYPQISVIALENVPSEIWNYFSDTRSYHDKDPDFLKKSLNILKTMRR